LEQHAGSRQLVHTAERKEQLLAALQSLASDPHTAQSFTGETPMPRCFVSWPSRPWHKTWPIC